MNWNIVIAICEIVGAIAVVVSLIYLAFQIKSQSAETRSAAMHDFYAGFREAIASFADSEIADITIRGNHDIDSLTEVEKFRLASCAQQIHRLYEEAFNMRMKGRLEDDSWTPMVRQYSSFMAAPSIQFVWKIRKNYYNEQFQEFVDSLEVTAYLLDDKQNDV